MFAKVSVQKPYTVAVGIILVLVLGVISFMNMTTDLLPSMNLPYIVVYTPYIGASPEAVEDTVTRPLEAAMATVGELQSITSSSSENVSSIVLQFSETASMDTAMLELNTLIDRVRADWPDNVGAPTMIKLNPDMLPIVVSAVDMEGKDIISLSEYVENTLLGELEGIDGVASVSASGVIEEEITVSIEQSLIDNVNSIILKEVDKELYKVEQKLIDGEQKLNDAKGKLSREGKAGLKQLDDTIDQLAHGQAQLGPAIEKLTAQRTDMTQQLAQARAAIPQLEGALAQMAGVSMGESEKQMYAQLEEKISSLKSQRTTSQKALDEVEKQLGIEKPTPTPAPSGDPGASPSPSLAPSPSATPSPTPSPTAAPLPTPTPRPTRKPGPRPNLSQEQDDLLGALRATPEPAAPAETPAPPAEDAQSAIAPTAQAAGFSLMRTAYAAEEMTDEELRAERARLQGEIAGFDSAIAAIEQSGAYQSLKQLAAAAKKKAELTAQLEGAKAAVPQLEAGISQVDQMIEKLGQGIVPGGVMEGIDKDTNLEDARDQLIKTRKEVKTQLGSAESQIEKAQKELGEARKEFEEKREEAFKEAKLDGVITIQLVSQIIAAQNLSMPAGYLTEDGQEYLVRVGDEFQTVDELSKTILFKMDLDTIKEVRLCDVAEVGITNNADSVYAKVNGNDGILLSFQKQSTYSTAEVADKILEKFDELHQRTPGLRMTPLVDQGIYIDMIIDSVMSNLISGAALAILVLLLFLGDFRPTLIIALSIPTSVVVAFVAMYFTGVTLNVISLTGLALGIGMLVDNSIVVIENIYRLHGDGVPILRACVEGTSQMAGAIFSSTLTTICVFLPLVFITGIARQMFTDMGLTITYSLLASLLVAMTVVPALSSSVLKKKQRNRKHRAFKGLLRAYSALLRTTLRFKFPVLLLSLALLVFTVFSALNMGTAFIPDVDSTQMTATLSIPVDSTYDETIALTNQVMDVLLGIEDVDTIGVFTSSNAGMTMISGSSGMSYYITLKEGKTRRNTEIAQDMLDAAAPLGVDLSVKVSNMDITAMMGSGINVEVKGPDLDVLRRIATDVAAQIATIEGTIDVSDGQEETVPELTLRVDKQKAVENGLTVAQIYQYVAQWVSEGVEVSSMTQEGKTYAVMAVEGKNLTMTREELADRTIEVKKADETIQVRLGDVCDVSETLSLSSIQRSQQQHLVTASCGVDAEHNVGLVGREISALIEDYEVPEGYSIALSGESDTIDSALGDLMLMVLLAVVLIYLIMVAQFQSFLMPFIVLFTIPLAITGGLLALMMMELDLSVVAMLGFLILSGVIVNNGIVFVDTVNQLRLDGMEKRAALVEAGQLRLRPILMTALTTILGMSTMAAAQGMGAEMMQPVAVVTIGGLTYGTLLTLFVVPALYDMFTRKNLKSRKIDGEAGALVGKPVGIRAGDEAAAPAVSPEDLDAEYAAFISDVDDLPAPSEDA